MYEVDFLGLVHEVGHPHEDERNDSDLGNEENLVGVQVSLRAFVQVKRRRVDR